MCSLSFSHTLHHIESSSQFTMKIFLLFLKQNNSSYKPVGKRVWVYPFIFHSTLLSIPALPLCHFIYVSISISLSLFPTFSLQKKYNKHSVFSTKFYLCPSPKKDCCSVDVIVEAERSKFVCANTSCLHSTSTTPPTKFLLNFSPVRKQAENLVPSKTTGNGVYTQKFYSQVRYAIVMPSLIKLTILLMTQSACV